MGYVEPIPHSNYTQPAAIVYATAWSKTPVDDTLSVAGEAADAKATGDALDELNERLDDVTVTGLNLFDIRLLEGKEGITVNGDTFSALPQTLYTYGDIYGVEYEAGQQYTVSLEAKTTSQLTSNGLRVDAHYTDSSSSLLCLYLNSQSTYLKKTGTTTAGKTVSSITIAYSNNSNTIWDVKQFQIEKGTVAHDYVPFELSAVDKYVRALVPELENFDLYPSGDTTDRSLEISQILQDKRVCRLAPGEYTIDVIALQTGRTLTGCGRYTRLFKKANSSYNYMIRLSKDCQLQNLAIYGNSSDIEVSNNWDLHGDTPAKCAIRIEGTGSEDQLFHAEVTDVYIERFAGSAIYVSKTGYNPQGGCHFDNIFVRNCNAGISLGSFAEFHRITGCSFFACYYGCVNNGGNNVFVNCDFSTNVQGLLMDNSRGNYSNSSHGSFVGCTFNHSDSNNGTAIELNTMIAGEMFVGCNIFYGSIILTNSQGIVFDACNFGSSTPIILSGGGSVVFSSCIFRGNQSPVTDDRTDKTFFNGCYYLGGQPRE